MDALTALSLAGSIVQFLDFTNKLLRGAAETYRSGSFLTREQANFQPLIQDLQNAILPWSQPALPGYNKSGKIQPEDADDKALRELCICCNALLGDMQKSFNKFDGRNPQSKLDAIRSSWFSLRSRNDLQVLQSRTDSYRMEIILRISLMMKEEQSSTARKLDELIDEARLYHLSSEKLMRQQRHRIAQHSSQLRQPVGVACPENQFADMGDLLLDLARMNRETIELFPLLDALRFEAIDFRVRGIKRAHAKTFEWIFDACSIGNEFTVQNTFRDWLSAENGLYHISGKAGSGKSTLMKFLALHERTQVELQKWLPCQQLIFCHFYFWNAGTSMQKSLEGLLRSMLLEIICKHPALAREAFPNYNSRQFATRCYQDFVDAFERLVKNDEISANYKFCILIDGLDEYDGDHREIIKLLKAWTSAAHVKMCVSSRPWNVFEAAFSSNRRLYLHDITRDDIERYVRENFEEDENFQRLSMEDDFYAQLISQIVHKAEGVFLWVYLVTRSLLDGLVNDDRLVDLQRKLEAMPRGLVPMFHHMLQSVDESYKPWTARSLIVAEKSSESLPALVYSFLDDIEEDPSFALDAAVHALSTEEISLRVERTRKRLDARCRGLLEIRMFYRTREAVLSKRVDFLHRTVLEFIREEEVQHELMRLSQAFDAEGCLSHAYLAMIKLMPVHFDLVISCGPLSELIEYMLYWVRLTEIKTGIPQVGLVEDLEHVLWQHLKHLGCDIESGRFPQWRDTKKGNFSIVEFAAIKGLFYFVTKRVDRSNAKDVLAAIQNVSENGYLLIYQNYASKDLLVYLNKFVSDKTVETA